MNLGIQIVRNINKIDSVSDSSCTTRQVFMVFEGIQRNPRSYNGSYWFIRQNLEEIKIRG